MVVRCRFPSTFTHVVILLWCLFCDFPPLLSFVSHICFLFFSNPVLLHITFEWLFPSSNLIIFSHATPPFLIPSSFSPTLLRRRTGSHPSATRLPDPSTASVNGVADGTPAAGTGPGPGAGGATSHVTMGFGDDSADWGEQPAFVSETLGQRHPQHHWPTPSQEHQVRDGEVGAVRKPGKGRGEQHACRHEEKVSRRPQDGANLEIRSSAMCEQARQAAGVAAGGHLPILPCGRVVSG